MKDKTNKELALSLINDLIYLENLQDSELQKIKKEKNSTHNVSGKSAIHFHLEVLKELVEKI